MFETVGYKPSKWQNDFHHARDESGRFIDELLGAGAAGPGKSICLLMDPVWQIVQEHDRAFDERHPHPIEPGQSVGWALHLRRTNPMLEQTIKRALSIFPRLDPGFKYDTNKMIGTFTSGYRYQFGHCAESLDYNRYIGNEYTHIAFDELVQFEEEQYEQIINRLRTSDPHLRSLLKIRAMSNPLMRQAGDADFSFKGNPHWVRDRFVKPWKQGRKILKKKITLLDGSQTYVTRMYLPARLSDNPDPNFARDYEVRLQNTKKHIRDALLSGDWFKTAGSFFGDVWNEDIHVCEPFRIPPYWPVWRAMDWGFKVPGVVGWFAMDEDGNVFMFKEMTFEGKWPDAVADMIKDVEMTLGLWDTRKRKSTVTGPADTQLWEQRGDIGKSKAAVFMEKGVTWFPADKKSRATNAMHIHKALRDNRGGTPGLVFMANCQRTIQTVPMIQTDVKFPDAPSEGGDDHWYDMLAYSMKHASRGRSVIARAALTERDEDDDAPVPVVRKHGRGYYSSV